MEPCIVSTSRTSFQPSAGRSTKNAVLAPREPGGTSGSVRATRIANCARRVFEMNHLWPLMIHSSPSFSARVSMSVGSEPATSGSVMAKHDMAVPSHNRLR